MKPAELKQSALKDARPPAGLGEAALALWYLKKGDWEKSHAIAQDLHDAHGAWIHALLHLVEGDLSNARYWFAEAGRPSVKPAQAEALWDEIAAEVLA
ncbi:MAG: hypothetical protein EBR62_01430 [Verrucomicrobia bacterium]|jgi:hypothetical protein|nr:hypothetical protein [Verrucomicrobiota bacterium]